MTSLFRSSVFHEPVLRSKSSLYVYLSSFLPNFYMLAVFLHASAFLFSFCFLHKLWEYWIIKIAQGARSWNKRLNPQPILVFDNVFSTQCFDLLLFSFFFFVILAVLRTCVFLVFLSLVFLKNLQHYKKHFTASFLFHFSFSPSKVCNAFQVLQSTVTFPHAQIR